LVRDPMAVGRKLRVALLERRLHDRESFPIA
jgi:hypothetical protein